MVRPNAEAVIVATQTTAITAALLGGSAVVMLLGVVVSRQPLALNASLAPIVFALACTVAAGALVWLQSRRTLRAHDALDDARARERIVATLSFDALLTLTTDGVIEALNPAGERVFGVAQAAAAGCDFRTLVDLQDGSETSFFDVVTLGGRRRAAAPRRAIGRRADGATFEVHVAFADAPTASGIGVLALVRDLSTPAIAKVQDAGTQAEVVSAAAPDADLPEPQIFAPAVVVAAEPAPSAPLPIEATPCEIAAAIPTVAAKARLRVLVCDDDPELCTILEALLRAQGARTHIVHDIDGAVAALLAGRFDVMLLDLQLGGGDGLDVLRTLPSPQRAPLQQVILLSSDASAQIDADEFPVAIVDRVEKPVRLDLLRRSVQLAFAHASAARDEARPIILHVDDDPDIRRLVHDLLTPTGEVIAVATLFEAKRKLSAIDPDLVVLDIGLRDGSGLELIPLLTSAAGHRIPSIVFSGRTADASRREGEVKVFAKSCASFEALAVEARHLVGRGPPGELRAEAA